VFYRLMLLATLSTVLFGPDAVRAYEFSANTNIINLDSLGDFDRCVEETGEVECCLDALTKYVAAHPEIAFSAGKHARFSMTHWVALHFFVKSLDKPTAQQCQDEDLRLAVISGLSLPPDDPELDSVRKIASGSCWSELQTPVVKGLQNGSTYYKQNTCALLATKQLTLPACATKAEAAPEPTALRSAKLATIDVRTLALDGNTAALFRGEGPELVLVIRAKAPHSDVVLLKVKNVYGPWNNHMLMAAEHRHYSDREYVANVDGHDQTIMRRREGFYEAYPAGYETALPVYRQLLSDQPKPLSTKDIIKEFSQGVSR